MIRRWSWGLLHRFQQCWIGCLVSALALRPLQLPSARQLCTDRQAPWTAASSDANYQPAPSRLLRYLCSPL